ncbi:MAG TPA: uracil-DNA glycosylase [Candidatus Aquilonibacter sp.]|nr:uracil-DNA glycosylase [Candidatus Aquilonibacter sp.]
MAEVLTPELRRALAERVRYYNELGIYDFYQRASRASQSEPIESSALSSDLEKSMAAKKSLVVVPAVVPNTVAPATARAEHGVADPVSALKLIREDLGDCTRCKLHQQGRKQIVFGVGNPRAELMFVGEGPGADEDAQGEPFVGRAGQLLNNMIKAMGLRREDVYIANIVKCRPPGNRTPERDECETCSPFLMRQIAVIKPKAIVALGAVAAKNLLAINAPMSELRGRWYDFKPVGSDPAWPGARLAVTYHPAFLLRDPRQKVETWKDLQMVMKYLGIVPPKKTAE